MKSEYKHKSEYRPALMNKRINNLKSEYKGKSEYIIKNNNTIITPHVLTFLN